MTNENVGFTISEEAQETFRDPEAMSAISQMWGGGTDTAVSMPSRPGRPLLRLQYWRKCTREGCLKHTNKKSGVNPEFGWITTGPTMQGDPYRHADYINHKHMEPLPQYGSSPTGTGADAELANSVTRFKKILEHPSQKGLWEFPVSQIQAYGWDKLEIVRKLRPETMSSRLDCEYGCVNRSFLTEENRKRHNKAVHPEVNAPIAAAKGIEASLKAVLEANKSDGTFTQEQLQQIGMVVATAVSELEKQKQESGRKRTTKTEEE